MLHLQALELLLDLTQALQLGHPGLEGLHPRAQRVDRLSTHLLDALYLPADRRVLQPRVIDCQFEDWKNGEYKIISFFAKRARGLMARYATTHRLVTVEALQGFDLEGYRYTPAVSTTDKLVFRREAKG